MLIDINDIDKISAIQLYGLSQSVIEPEFSKYFVSDPGREHYKLLAYVSTLFTNRVLLDIGTYKGCSALALSYNASNKVVSFDIRQGLKRLYDHPTNVNFIVDDVLKEEYNSLILDSPFIMLDTDHDGPFENEFYDHLISLDYRGVLMLDDIHLNEPMKAFWNRITHPKVDLTVVGHWSGTGLVHFN